MIPTTLALFYRLLRFTLPPLPIFSYPAGNTSWGLSDDVLSTCSNYRKLQAVFNSRPLPFRTRETAPTGEAGVLQSVFGSKALHSDSGTGSTQVSPPSLTTQYCPSLSTAKWLPENGGQALFAFNFHVSVSLMTNESLLNE